MLTPGSGLRRSSPSNIGEPSLCRRITDDLSTRLQPELFAAAGLVCLDRLDADVEPTRDFLVGKTEGGQLEHLGLAVGQIGLAAARPFRALRVGVEHAVGNARVDVQPAGDNGTNRLNEVFGRRPLENISTYARRQGL